ncbi:MAG: imidazole glycerol phosphate synthase subunit HisH [Methanoregulaceae archaeon]|nr:imidazole glycerol phosphate synthase subunit HisH [Methanoregulaceae archaeon]
MTKIVIVDYGLGNLRSVFRGIEKAGALPVISSDPEEVSAADGVVLPGVGAFREGMDQLGDLSRVITGMAGDAPILGICLGMQMLMEWSEEHGLHRGLALVPGTVRRFPHKAGFKVPHMGWNTLEFGEADDPLFEGIPSHSYVYFVHSYYADTTASCTIATTGYSCRFASAIRKDGSWGVQFHPEKSGAVGLRILENYIGMI